MSAATATLADNRLVCPVEGCTHSSHYLVEHMAECHPEIPVLDVSSLTSDELEGLHTAARSGVRRILPDLASMSATADSALSITAYLTGWEASEVVTIQLVSPDGSSADLEGATAPDSGVATVTLTHAGVAAGVYSIEATGSSGGKASAALVVSAGK